MSKTVDELAKARNLRETKTVEASAVSDDFLAMDNDGKPTGSPHRKVNFELIFFSLMSILVVASFLMSYAAIAKSRDVKTKTRDFDMQFVGYFDEHKKRITSLQRTMDMIAAESQKQSTDFSKQMKDMSGAIEKANKEIKELNNSYNQLRSYVNDLNKAMSLEINNLKSRR